MDAPSQLILPILEQVKAVDESVDKVSLTRMLRFLIAVRLLFNSYDMFLLTQ